MHCDHFVSSENLLNQNDRYVKSLQLIWLISDVSSPYKIYQTNLTPDENLSKRSYVQEQLTIGNLTTFLPLHNFLCHILILHI